MKIIEGHEKDYHLKCKIKIVDHYYTEPSDGKRYATTAAFLVPDVDATETSRFLDAWLPEIGTICLDCHEHYRALAMTVGRILRGIESRPPNCHSSAGWNPR